MHDQTGMFPIGAYQRPVAADCPSVALSRNVGGHRNARDGLLSATKSVGAVPEQSRGDPALSRYVSIQRRSVSMSGCAIRSMRVLWVLDNGDVPVSELHSGSGGIWQRHACRAGFSGGYADTSPVLAVAPPTRRSDHVSCLGATSSSVAPVDGQRRPRGAPCIRRRRCRLPRDRRLDGINEADAILGTRSEVPFLYG
jgi:hypothetical protein